MAPDVRDGMTTATAVAVAEAVAGSCSPLGAGSPVPVQVQRCVGGRQANESLQLGSASVCRLSTVVA